MVIGTNSCLARWLLAGTRRLALSFGSMNRPVLSPYRSMRLLLAFASISRNALVDADVSAPAARLVTEVLEHNPFQAKVCAAMHGLSIGAFSCILFGDI
eukprot:SAG31_NODE_1804_length_7234_cov_3.340855_1_plen_99_part_00